MNETSLFDLATPTPTIVGAGLVALDFIVDQDSDLAPSLRAGGTCGNVLTILSYLGWQSYPIARIKRDAVGRVLMNDLAHWNVNLDFIDVPPVAKVPIIVEYISTSSDGQRRHRYSFTCPGCGAWFPSYKPIRDTSAKLLMNKIPQPQVFFMDRISRGILTLARRALELGAVVVFEPSTSLDPRLFQEALAICHILKYSSQRLRNFDELGPFDGPLLEIETMGAEGLRYRCRNSSVRKKQWHCLSAFQSNLNNDTAGSGDWCTAGLLHGLVQKGFKQLLNIDDAALREALEFGQALGAWNCGFEGPRGGMYYTKFEEFKCQVLSIYNRRLSPPMMKQFNKQKKRRLKHLCSYCKSTRVKKRLATYS